jgi:hypothetical protein
MMQLPYDPEVVVIEYRGGTLLLEQPEEVAEHAQVFNRLRETAKSPKESLKDISHLAKLQVG